MKTLNKKFTVDFKERAEIFNDSFIKQCSLVNNNSKLIKILF